MPGARGLPHKPMSTTVCRSLISRLGSNEATRGVTLEPLLSVTRKTLGEMEEGRTGWLETTGRVSAGLDAVTPYSSRVEILEPQR
jgi:hypothetical protein